ncbi:hypothetical protein BS78_08G067400 [Paspalum vaginatum]|nr:hypothetical protein BS78_08G067400 [Paspalum vaginatum]
MAGSARRWASASLAGVGVALAPIMRLEEVAVTTGEEDEDVLLDISKRQQQVDCPLHKEQHAVATNCSSSNSRNPSTCVWPATACPRHKCRGACWMANHLQQHRRYYVLALRACIGFFASVLITALRVSQI